PFPLFVTIISTADYIISFQKEKRCYAETKEAGRFVVFRNALMKQERGKEHENYKQCFLSVSSANDKNQAKRRNRGADRTGTNESDAGTSEYTGNNASRRGQNFNIKRKSGKPEKLFFREV